jgi:hypothetical protein
VTTPQRDASRKTVKPFGQLEQRKKCPRQIFHLHNNASGALEIDEMWFKEEDLYSMFIEVLVYVLTRLVSGPSLSIFL